MPPVRKPITDTKRVPGADGQKPAAVPAPRVGFAIGGGGTRGAFGVGALVYLTTVMQVGASVIAGTSVGALSALKLAHFAPQQQSQGAAELVDTWAGLSNDQDMWTWEPWLVPLLKEQFYGGRLQDFLEDFLHIKRTRDLYGPISYTVGSDSEVFSVISALIFGPIVAGSPAVPTLLGLVPAAIGLAATQISGIAEAFSAGQVRALTNIEPIEKQAGRTADLAKVKALEEARIVQLRLATVCLQKGSLRYITGTGAMLERDNITPVRTTTIVQEDPACAAIADQLQKMVTAAHTTDPRLKPTRDRDDVTEIRAMQRALAECRREHPPQHITRAAQVDLVKGAIASATMPAFFPPPVFFDESYVDGGVREIIPVDVAFKCGADMVYAIGESRLQSTPTDVTELGLSPRVASNSFSDLISIAGRSLMDLVFDEIGSDDVRGFGDALSVIAPTFNVYSPLLIDPGLIDIWIDYGLMRAADVAKYPPGVEDPRLVTGERAINLSDHLTRLRLAAWMAEHVIADAPIPQVLITHGEPGYLPRWRADGASIPWAASDALEWVRFLRVLEQGIVTQREQLGLVAGRIPSLFLNNWEKHPFSVSGVLWPNNLTRLRPPAAPPARRLMRDMKTGQLYQFTPAGAITRLQRAASANPPGTNAEVSDLPPGLIDALQML